MIEPRVHTPGRRHGAGKANISTAGARSAAGGRHKRHTLHDLQDSFDAEAKRQRLLALRASIAPTVRQDLRWGITALIGAAACLWSFAALTPA